MNDAKTMLSAKNTTSGTLTIIGKLGGEMFKNMKIPVENNLDDIVAELEKRGFTKQMKLLGEAKWVITRGNKYSLFDFEPSGAFDHFEPTNLAELKEM